MAYSRKKNHAQCIAQHLVPKLLNMSKRNHLLFKVRSRKFSDAKALTLASFVLLWFALIVLIGIIPWRKCACMAQWHLVTSSGWPSSRYS